MEISNQIVMVKTNAIKPYLRNARKNDETVNKLVDVISKVGFNQPIVIDKNNVIVKGHSRWKAAIRLGLKEVPCIISNNSDEVNKLDRLADNKVGEFSKWDEDLLATELSSIEFEDFDVFDLGFDEPNNEPVKMTIDEYSSMPTQEGGIPVFKDEPAKEGKPFIEERDVERTIRRNTDEFGSVICPKCGQTVLYKK